MVLRNVIVADRNILFVQTKDNTTKMFMTERGDPRGVFDVVYGCNPADDSLQLELVTPEQGTTGVKGNMGVRPFNGDLDFRWQPIGTTGMLLSFAYSNLVVSFLLLQKSICS